MLKKLSTKRAAQQREYLKRRAAFLDGKICPVTGEQATEIHHMKGRVGLLLTDERYWIPVSREGHLKIELNPVWAKEKGYSLSRLSK